MSPGPLCLQAARKGIRWDEKVQELENAGVRDVLPDIEDRSVAYPAYYTQVNALPGAEASGGGGCVDRWVGGWGLEANDSGSKRRVGGAPGVLLGDAHSRTPLHSHNPLPHNACLHARAPPQPFHGYQTGNLNWLCALEAEPATDMVGPVGRAGQYVRLPPPPPIPSPCPIGRARGGRLPLCAGVWLIFRCCARRPPIPLQVALLPYKNEPNLQPAAAQARLRNAINTALRRWGGSCGTGGQAGEPGGWRRAPTPPTSCALPPSTHAPLSPTPPPSAATRGATRCRSHALF